MVTIRSTMSAFEMILTLEGSDPPITRAFLIPSEASFADLDCTIHSLLGWANLTDHIMTVKGQRIGHTDSRIEGPFLDEDYTPISEYEGEKIEYVCGIDGCWNISLEWLGIEPEYDLPWPEIIDGSEDAPIEDLKGLDEYYSILESLDLEDEDSYSMLMDIVGDGVFDMGAIGLNLQSWPVQGIRDEGTTSLTSLTRLLIMTALEAAIDRPLVFDRIEFTPLVVKRSTPRKSKRRGSKKTSETEPPSIDPRDVEADPDRYIPLTDPVSVRGVKVAHGFESRHPEIAWPEYDVNNPEALGSIIMDNDLDDEFFDYMTEYCTRELLEWAKKNKYYFKDDISSIESLIGRMGVL